MSSSTKKIKCKHDYQYTTQCVHELQCIKCGKVVLA